MFIRLALRLPKYICSKLLYDSSGLPYVKDRLLSCASKSLDRNCTKSTSREVDIFQQAQSHLGAFSNAIICGPSCKSWSWCDLMGWASKRLSLSETGSPGYTRTRLAQSLDLELKCQHRLILEIPQASPSDTATGSLPLYFAHIVWVKFAHPTHLLTILIMYACHHNSFWGSRCDSNHAPTISL